MSVSMPGTGKPSHPTALTGANARSHNRNGALAALSSRAFSILEPHLRYQEFQEGAVLWDVGEQIDRLYFPLSGVVSIILPVKGGSGVEVASVGHEAAAGIDYGLRQLRSLTQGIVQIPGTFLGMPAVQFASAARRNDEINRVAAMCCNWLLDQSQRIAACNAIHPADARFCRWLLQCSAHVDNDVIPSTQEVIARALGIRRTTITLVAQGLQMKGIISYRRGKIVIRDRDRLRSAACDCWAALDRNNWPLERLVGKAAESHDNQDPTG